MVNATKKQMVDFIYGHCRIDGTKIPLTSLNKMSKDDLIRFIREDKKLLKAFEDYMKSEKAPAEAACAADEEMIRLSAFDDYMSNDEKSTQQLERELEYLVSQLTEKPKTLLAHAAFSRYMDNLPFGKVSFDFINDLIQRSMHADFHTALRLMEFAVDQEKYLGGTEDSDQTEWIKLKR